MPTYLSPRSLSKALGRAANGMSDAALASGLVIAVAFTATNLAFWPAVAALAVMVPVSIYKRRSSVRFGPILYLVIGAGVVYVYTLTFASQLPEVVVTPGLWIAAPKILLVLVAGRGTGLWRAISWTVTGYVVAELASVTALLQLGLPPVFDVLTAVILLQATLASVLVYLAARRAVLTQPRIQRAAREELIDDIRARMELRAAALMHDTILSHLSAITTSQSETLDGRLREQIDRDIRILTGQRWLAEPGEAPRPADVPSTTPLHVALAEARADGLEVETTGDFAGLFRLTARQATALGMAARQCLINVIKHSGVMRAEVAVYGTDDEVSVMIIDAGKGFDQDAVGPDRLGLRTSVHSRIREVGGAVQTWSTPGVGTSILIQLPVTAGHVVSDASDPVASEKLATEDIDTFDLGVGQEGTS